MVEAGEEGGRRPNHGSEHCKMCKQWEGV
jgi:hypothetical protein